MRDAFNRGADNACDGLLLGVATPARTSAAHHVLLCSARIAKGIAHGRIPVGRDLFLLEAAIVDASNEEDVYAVELGLDGAARLLKSIPAEGKWEECRGHLAATMEFAWLLLRKEPTGHALRRGSS